MNTRSLFLLFSIAILAAGTKSFSSNMQPTSNNIQKTILTFDKISNGAEISKKDLEDARQKFLATYTETEAIGAYPAIKKIISENSTGK